MGHLERIESSLRQALQLADGPYTPPRLRQAMQHAVLGGGARLRPSMAFAVAAACGDAAAPGLEEVATSVELLHSASLVHDDLPCFDDAEMRRGRPSVHAAFGEPLAVLVGDALIALSFEHAISGGLRPAAITGVVRILSASIGSARGLVAGQAWESEPVALLSAYHQAKTGALFEASAALGATVAGSRFVDEWAAFGASIGEAYQVADDLRDVLALTQDKPAHQDAHLGRPNAARELGPKQAIERLSALLRKAAKHIPDCPHPQHIHAWLEAASERLCLAMAERAEGKPAVAAPTTTKPEALRTAVTA